MTDSTSSFAPCALIRHAIDSDKGRGPHLEKRHHRLCRRLLFKRLLLLSGKTLLLGGVDLFEDVCAGVSGTPTYKHVARRTRKLVGGSESADGLAEDVSGAADTVEPTADAEWRGAVHHQHMAWNGKVGGATNLDAA